MLCVVVTRPVRAGVRSPAVQACRPLDTTGLKHQSICSSHIAKFHGLLLMFPLEVVWWVKTPFAPTNCYQRDAVIISFTLGGSQLNFPRAVARSPDWIQGDIPQGGTTRPEKGDNICTSWNRRYDYNYLAWIRQ